MQNSKIKYFLLLIIIFLIVFGFSRSIRESPIQSMAEVKEEVKPIDKNSYVKIAEQNIKVDLAMTEEAQAKGLSGRSELKENEGMLFVFDQLGEYPFWMKDMNFPIDIIWLVPTEGGDAREAKIIYIKKNAQPKLYPEIYEPNSDAKYVLEVTAGFSDKNNLKEGDIVLFSS